MKPILILYLLNTGIFVFPLFRQMRILAASPDGDIYFWAKLLALVFNMAIMAAMWLGYFYIREAAWFFFLVAVSIAYFTYHHKNQNR